MKKVLSLFVLLSMNVQVNAADNTSYVMPDSVALKFGRYIWMNNCEGCHGYGIADAPVPMRPKDWEHRVAKGKTLLYRHAIDGFISDDYSEMPARGGNEELRDEHVRAAVDYMLFLANFYIKQEGEL